MTEDSTLTSFLKKVRNIRQYELWGRTTAVTLIHPEGSIPGISSDYPYIKIFDPAPCVI